jgi:hypothetical protein
LAAVKGNNSCVKTTDGKRRRQLCNDSCEKKTIVEKKTTNAVKNDYSFEKKTASK